MTESAIAVLSPDIGQAAACRAVGRSRATHHRRHRRSPLPVRPTRRPARAQPRALSPSERQGLLDVLHSERFCDVAPAEVWATLIDEGTYLASVTTMYRVLRAHGEVRERRRQRSHPATVKPELVATAPNQCWSWDITKLLGPAKWTYYYLYVIIDVRHEAPLHRVGWKDPPVACRSRPPKLRAARTWERRQGREQPRQRRDEPALPDGAGPTSKTGRCTRETSA